MSSKSNRRSKGDKGPAKSSQSKDLVFSLGDSTDIDMSLLNGINMDINSLTSLSTPHTENVAYFGANDSYRIQLKMLTKKSTVTKSKV
jgi:hypothetical protein